MYIFIFSKIKIMSNFQHANYEPSRLDISRHADFKENVQHHFDNKFQSEVKKPSFFTKALVTAGIATSLGAFSGSTLQAQETQGFQYNKSKTTYNAEQTISNDSLKNDVTSMTNEDLKQKVGHPWIGKDKSGNITIYAVNETVMNKPTSSAMAATQMEVEKDKAQLHNKQLNSQDIIDTLTQVSKNEDKSKSIFTNSGSMRTEVNRIIADESGKSIITLSSWSPSKKSDDNKSLEKPESSTTSHVPEVTSTSPQNNVQNSDKSGSGSVSMY